MTRMDLWLWAVRVYKTRSMATEACRGGHVRLNGRPAKAASPVKVGDQVSVRFPGWERVLEVQDPISRRVGAKIAVQCYIDHSPQRPAYLANPVARRDPGTGRPTKKQRRDLERLRGY